MVVGKVQDSGGKIYFFKAQHDFWPWIPLPLIISFICTVFLKYGGKKTNTFYSNAKGCVCWERKENLKYYISYLPSCLRGMLINEEFHFCRGLRFQVVRDCQQDQVYGGWTIFQFHMEEVVDYYDSTSTPWNKGKRHKYEIKTRV